MIAMVETWPEAAVEIAAIIAAVVVLSVIVWNLTR